MLITQPPRPEDCSRAEHEGTTLGVSVQRQIVCSGARPNRVAVVKQESVDRERGGRQWDEACRPEAVVG